MKRHYFISDDLDDLERIEEELELRGINKPQIHVLSKDNTAIASHKHFYNIDTVFKQDVIHGTIVGAILGVLSAVLVMAIGYMSGLSETHSWTPFYFLAIIMFGFVTWSGGFYGIQTPQRDFRRFQKDLDAGRHIFIVDIDPSQEDIINQVKYEHPHLSDAGTGSKASRRTTMRQQNFKDITTTTFP